MHLSAAELNQYIFDQILGFCSKTYLQSSTNKISIKEISINMVFKKSNFLIFRNVSLKSHSRDCHPDYSQKTVLSFDFLTHYLRNSLTKLMHLKSLCSLFAIDSGLLTLMALFSTDPFCTPHRNKLLFQLFQRLKLQWISAEKKVWHQIQGKKFKKVHPRPSF